MKKNIRKFKSCPGCGSKNLGIETRGPSNDSPMWIRCRNCGCDGPGKLTADEAIKAWNKRVYEIEIFWAEKPTPIW